MAREAVIVESVRTALCKAHRGSFNLTSPVDQLAHCIKTAVERTSKLDPEEISDVIAGCGFPEGVQGMNTARIAAMAAGLPVSVAGTTVNRFCSSGSQAIAMAAQQIVMEGADFVRAWLEARQMKQGSLWSDPHLLSRKRWDRRTSSTSRRFCRSMQAEIPEIPAIP